MEGAGLSRFYLKVSGGFWKLLRAVRLKWSSPAEGRGCQGLGMASWRGTLWMCVIKPTVRCLSVLEVKVVKQLFFKNRAAEPVGFLWF